MNLSCFKAYDVRGKVPADIDGQLAFGLGQAACAVLGCTHAVIGHDARLSGPALSSALANGLLAGGATVTDIGLCGTEEIYHATARHGFDLGIMVTGSHNPADENGFKLVRTGARPVSADSGLMEMRDWLARQNGHQQGQSPTPAAHCTQTSFRQEYLDWLLDFTGLARIGESRPLRLVADAGNGCAGLLMEKLAQRLPLDLVLLNATPDGNFPNGVPNPLLPERREATAAAVRRHGADLGIAWDGDFDRCFFYDGEGNFVEGYYLVGLMACEMLRLSPGGRIIHDPRVYWNTRELVSAAGGIPVMGKTGHAFMKERMRAENAIYGGEMSAHHYFRDFACCDSGMLPWLLLVRRLMQDGTSLAELVADRMRAYPCSGEMNRRVADAPQVMQAIRARYAPEALHEDDLDGLNLEFAQWRFSLRMSNTEPLLRLNVESRGDVPLLEDRTAELLALVDSLGR